LRERAGPALGGAVLSSLRRVGDLVEARVVNESGAASQVRFGDVTATLRPWEIRTLVL